jgi:hypothetical protein
VFYRVVSAGAIEKTERAYAAIQREVLKLRRSGRLRYDWIADGTRWNIKQRSWDSVEDALHDAASSYRRALWHDQDVYVEVWSEKEAISSIVSPISQGLLHRLHAGAWRKSAPRALVTADVTPAGWSGSSESLAARFNHSHEDENPFNNDPSNLVCITRKEHPAHHRERYERLELREQLAEIRPLASEWHRSPEGRAWHSEHGRRTWAGREPTTATCTVCRNPYRTFFPERSMYCSPACDQRASRMEMRYFVPATCPICGKTFLQHRTAKRPATCGRTCGAALRRHSRGVRPDR